MADISRNRTSASASSPAQPSRLQRRRPASLQINPPTSSCWNTAIPLLSPLVTSPIAIDQMAEMNQQQPLQHRNQGTEPDKPTVFKKWQHPAAPFCCEPAPFGPKFFVPV
ncbi:uncharacterized protein At4g14450, chloroplastic [Manihot esculenta]|uniref:Uncharacterized protein n=1 Tax=Manihot esculenta TaxID=3983 RepID=A0A2C9UDR7_MANES|nr:uncharacterized protein At4g14450, chloroplastic [Manihot esculenta]OAY28065.1 hypothetical protein MANES_15G038200v8 [Manihot esculenta]